MSGRWIRVACLLCGFWALGACSEQAKEAEPIPAPAVSSAQLRTVYFKALTPFLPQKLKGYEQVKDEGSTGKYGEVVVSEAERVFRAPGGNEVSVRIVDTSIAEKLGKAISAAAADAKLRDPDDPSAPIISDHAVGFVRFDEDNTKAEANLLVGDRYVVAVTTEGFPDTRELRRLTHELNLLGLSKLR